MQLGWRFNLVLGGGAVAAVLFFSLSPRHVRHDDRGLHRVGELLYYGSRPFNGFEDEYFDDGELYKENRYENGRLEGASREYSFHHVLREIWRYHGGRKDGLQEGWFAEGPKRFEFHFKDGVLDGEQVEWHLNGQVFRRRVYAMGLETEKKILYPHAEVFSNYVIRAGRQYGLDGGALCLEVKAEGSR